MKDRIQAIDIVVNLWTPEANALRPKRDAFYQGKMKVKKETAEGISLKEMLGRMDAVLGQFCGRIACDFENMPQSYHMAIVSPCLQVLGVVPKPRSLC